MHQSNVSDTGDGALRRFWQRVPR